MAMPPPSLLEDITYHAPPGTMFNVYLESSADAKKKVQVGTLSFFDSPHKAAAEGHQHAETTNRDFDVTDALRVIAAGQPNLDSGTVTFEATNGRVGTTENSTVNAASDLSVGKIMFQLKRVQ
jgi:hypothetical protein